MFVLGFGPTNLEQHITPNLILGTPKVGGSDNGVKQHNCMIHPSPFIDPHIDWLGVNPGRKNTLVSFL